MGRAATVRSARAGPQGPGLDAAGKLGPVRQLVVLLGGEAGLRMGAMIALEWNDVDLERGLFKVQRSDWTGHVTLPKRAALVRCR
ncbi:MAG TPA: hypothetical protein VE057_07910 [Archangium sp.]|nr:hypothetical protein [Archangium sp.]